MKPLLITLCSTVIGLSLLLPVSANTLNQEKNKKSSQTTTTQEVKKDVRQNSKNNQALKPGSKNTNNIPVYKPPLRGAPAGRVAGGTRGVDQELPYLCLIVPKHIGLTISSQPVLYFYQSKISSYPVEFTLIQKQGISPIVETRLAHSSRAGIQSVHLADYGVNLETGIEYKWFIALIPDARHRSKDILAAGSIELVEQPGTIKERLTKAETFQAPHIYAEGGLWYDAFYALSSLIEKSPENLTLKKQRASLLEQVGLTEVAGRDMSE